MLLNPRASSTAHVINNGEVVDLGGDGNDNDAGDGDVEGFDDVE